ncbi:MAG: RNA methyltransferase [Bacillota bacterium]|nr:RNA methyltransferase [Bacillota bacterium]
MIKITATNDKIKLIKKLNRSGAREKSGMFIIEGRRAVTDAIENGAEISFIMYCEGSDFEFESSIQQYSLDRKTFAEITDTSSPQDLLAVAKMKPLRLDDIVKASPSLIIVCDRVQDPGNLGTIIRTADAVGNAAVIISEGSVDMYNPKVIRSTMSSIFNLPIAKDVDILPALDTFKNLGYKVVCGALRAESSDLFSSSLRGKCIIIIGNEGSGASNEVIEASDILVKIPINGRAESLNASVSCGILAYEHYRQNN